MDTYVDLLCATQLFRGIRTANARMILDCFEYKVRTFEQGEVIFPKGSAVESIGLILSGRAEILYKDLYGDTVCILVKETGEFVGDLYSCARNNVTTSNIAAQTRCELLLLNTRRVLEPCELQCENHKIITRNLIAMIADEGIRMGKRMAILSGRTIRGKLLTYLAQQARDAGSNTFFIPYSRQELADFLFIERTAMSTELNKLKRDGVLDFDRQRFTIYKDNI